MSSIRVTCPCFVWFFFLEGEREKREGRKREGKREKGRKETYRILTQSISDCDNPISLKKKKELNKRREKREGGERKEKELPQNVHPKRMGL